jgi:hypothetical protein
VPFYSRSFWRGYYDSDPVGEWFKELKEEIKKEREASLFGIHFYNHTDSQSFVVRCNLLIFKRDEEICDGRNAKSHFQDAVHGNRLYFSVDVIIQRIPSDPTFVGSLIADNITYDVVRNKPFESATLTLEQWLLVYERQVRSVVDYFFGCPPGYMRTSTREMSWTEIYTIGFVAIFGSLAIDLFGRAILNFRILRLLFALPAPQPQQFVALQQHRQGLEHMAA